MDNKEIVRRVTTEPWTGNYAVIDELVAADYVGHDPALPRMRRARAAYHAHAGSPPPGPLRNLTADNSGGHRRCGRDLMGEHRHWFSTYFPTG